MCVVLAVSRSAALSPICLLSQVPGASAPQSSKCSSDIPSPCVVLAQLSQIHRRGGEHLGLALLSHPSPSPKSAEAPSCEQIQLAHLGLISTSRFDSSLSSVGL